MAAQCLQPFLNLSSQPNIVDETCPKNEVCELHLRQVIGFNGNVKKGLIVHTKGDHVIFPVGYSVVIEKLIGPGAGSQEILTGHTDTITAMALSTDGQFLVTGQQIAQEMKAPIILWDWCSREKLMEFPLHKTRVEYLAFTCNNKYFISLGGQDDESVVFWCVLEKKPLCGKLATLKRTGIMRCVATSKVNEFSFASGGDSYGRIWTFDSSNKSLDNIELRFANNTRVIDCMEIVDDNPKNPLVFCGTTSGDVMVFHAVGGALQFVVPNKQIAGGITSLAYTRMLEDNVFCLLIGSGEGKMGYYTVTLSVGKGNLVSGAMAMYKGYKTWSSDRDNSAVTSISKIGAGHQFYIGTKNCQIYRFNLAKWTAELVRTCSNNRINSIAFPRASDELMVVGEFEYVRVFNLKILLEVRRYFRANRNCLVVMVSHDGTALFTGWDNGETIILGFEADDLSLKELYRIDNTQKQAVTAMALTSRSDLLVTGGNDAQCRVWKLVADLDCRGRKVRQGLLLYNFVDQAGPITMIKMSDTDKAFASTSMDGTAAIYDLNKGVRRLIVKVTNGLNAVDFLTDECQFIVCGSAGKIFIFDSTDGESLIELDGVKHGSVNCLEVEKKFRAIFVTVGEDRLVKLWHTEQGVVTHVGRAHSDDIICCRLGSCSSLLVSGGKDGTICIWDLPQGALQG
ncbi:cilia- and flagella-associated protein 52-like [Biomphalaria glabrata]|uniref:Cilia- and flagella-associated protein 52 n=2 Tax=Biomphalaria glabrata TaxID=6526 RepID=A0A9W2ZEZ0_BIOGL|nr:cilia- and flagella-associated protein 52-like [Biomphalaria glabrata]XP_055873536.1 cilia- and flagella-associated protein 52-like [Biomphalaria glabrata]